MELPSEETQDYQKAIRNVVQHLKLKRSELQNDINCDEKEKALLTGELNKLQDRISVLNANLKKKSEFRNEYDKAISQSEENFEKLLKKSEDFLAVTRREALALSNATCHVPATCACSESRTKSVARSPSSTPAPVPAPAAVALTVTQAPQRALDADCFGCSAKTSSPAGVPCATLVVPHKANGL